MADMKVIDSPLYSMYTIAKQNLSGLAVVGFDSEGLNSGFVVVPNSKKYEWLENKVGRPLEEFYIESKTGHPLSVRIMYTDGTENVIYADAVAVFTSKGHRYDVAVIYYKPPGEMVFKMLGKPFISKRTFFDAVGTTIVIAFPRGTHGTVRNISAINIQVYPVAEFEQRDIF